MGRRDNWNWEIGEAVVPIAGWSARFAQVEALVVSPCGERIATIVREEDGARVCVDGDLWDETFDKAWHPRFSPDSRLTALVSRDDEWTLAVDGEPWEDTFEYAWGTLFSRLGENIAVCAQDDSVYRMARDGAPWEDGFHQLSDGVLSREISSRYLHCRRRWTAVGFHILGRLEPDLQLI